MFKYLLAASAIALVATPAAARDGAGYFGIEGGSLIDGSMDVDFAFDDGEEVFEFDDAAVLNFEPGIDVDLIAGMDFGPVRAEVELGHKRLKVERVKYDDDIYDDISDSETAVDDIKGRVRSAMVNVLFDAVNRDDSSIYIGAGIGRGWVKLEDASDSAWAGQLIVGARTALSANVDAGVKYRYFRTSKLNFQDAFEDEDIGYTASVGGKLQTHSLLLSLIFNFGGAPVAAPVVVAPVEPVVDTAPPPPATQTCPDGTVILATAVCPPPPAPPAGERG